MNFDVSFTQEKFRRLRHLLAAICKGPYSIGEIDLFFITNGAEQEWHEEADDDVSSLRMKNVFGWFDGLECHAPEDAARIVHGVVIDILDDDRLNSGERKRLERLVDFTDVKPNSLDTYNLHPGVSAAAAELVADGHYRMAIFQTYLALVDAVKHKSGRPDLDGTSLMDHVFSPSNPILKVSDDDKERLGHLWLFKGAVMGIRNPRGHQLGDERDGDLGRTLEWLAFASALFRCLDEAELVE